MNIEKLAAMQSLFNAGTLDAAGVKDHIQQAALEPYEAVINTEGEEHKLEIIIDEDNVIFTMMLTEEQSEQLQDDGFETV